jgi:pimeloyl-ACP methyl ester carboxylesterase
VRFEPRVADEALDDLYRRLSAWRPPAALPGQAWSYGVDWGYLESLVDTWLNDFDWRAVERRFGAYEHHRLDIDGQPIHYLRIPARGTRALPIILTHGWPASFWDYRNLIGPLSDPVAHGGDPADSFEVIVASLPGVAWSTPLRVAGLNYWRVAELWHRLMHETLGFNRYAAHGTDWGDMVSLALGHSHPDQVVGVHVTRPVLLNVFEGLRPWSADLLAHVGSTVPVETQARLLDWERRTAPHLAVQNIEPDTVAIALADSPVGWLAWFLQRLRAWSDCGGVVEACFSREDILSNATLLWATGSVPSSLRTYAEASREPWQPVREGLPVVAVSTGMSLFERDLPMGRGTSIDETYFNLTTVRWHDRGGHFPALEQPAALVEDIRETFRSETGTADLRS